MQAPEVNGSLCDVYLTGAAELSQLAGPARGRQTHRRDGMSKGEWNQIKIRVKAASQWVVSRR